jgi:hypothetical protein
MKKKILIIGKRSIVAKIIKKKLQIYFLVKHVSFNDFKKISQKKYKDFYLLINCSFKRDFHTLKNNPDIFIAKKIKKTSLKYIMLSSSKVYGVNSSTKKITEKFKCNPLTAYGSIRLKTENILKKLLCEKLLILRVTNILMFDLRNDNLSKNLINQMLNSLKNKSLIKIPKKKVIKDFVTIKFLVEVLLKLIKKKSTGIFNISSSFGISLRQIAFLLIKGFKSGKINYTNDVSDSFVLSNKKLFKITKKSINSKILKQYIFNLGKKLRNE